jgi:ParB family transcriptional regulator, chromosome partitioning protein
MKLKSRINPLNATQKGIYIMTKVNSLQLSHLMLWEGNARKIDVETNLAELKASIVSLGLLSPLTVFYQSDLDIYHVVAGQRRFIALQQLKQENLISQNLSIPCLVIEEKDALEASIAENSIREEMHPIDEYIAFKDLAEKGFTIGAIATKFGYEEKWVEKLLRLGRVHPDLLEAFRREEIGMDQLQAFTITDDQGEQLRIWEALKGKQSWQKTRRDILQAITKAEIPTTDKRVRFLGVEAYKEAGGQMRVDLFDDHNGGYILDVELLNKLVEEKLSDAKQFYIDAGWKWCEIWGELNYPERNKLIEEKGRKVPMSDEEKERLKVLKSEYDALDKIYEESDDGFTDDQHARYRFLEDEIERIEDRPLTYSQAVMKRSGVILTLDNVGQLDIACGMTRKADAKEYASNDGEKNEVNPEEKGISQSLLIDLHKERDAAIRCELLSRPDLTLIVFVFGLIKTYGGYLNVSITTHEPKKSTPAAKIFDAEHEKFIGWGMPEDRYDDEGIWQWLAGLREEELRSIANYYLAFSFNSHLSGRVRLLSAIGGFDMRDYFTPTAENYFKKISKEQIMADFKEMGFTNAPAGLGALEKVKKSELAKIAEDFIKTSTDGQAMTWVPKPLRFNLNETEETEEEEIDGYDE